MYNNFFVRFPQNSSPIMFYKKYLLFIFFSGLECIGHSSAFVAQLVFWRDVWIQT
jgi:hypothetical protein